MRKHIIGFLIIICLMYSMASIGDPVIPQFIADINAPIYMTGLIFAVMAFAQFIFAPFWGQISDIFGRRIAFIGPIGYAVGQLGFVFFDNPILLIIFRFISGAFAVIFVTIPFAYVSDKVAKEDKTKFLTFTAILIPIGLFIGFSFGGLIGHVFSPRAVFLFQAILGVIIGITLYFYMDDEIICCRNARVKWNFIKENKAVMHRNKDTGLKYVLLITFLNIISYYLIFSQATVILQVGFAKTTSYIGLFIALSSLIAGLSSFAIQGSLLKMVSSKYKLLPHLSLASLCSSLLAFSVVVFNPVAMWFGLMLAASLNTIFIALIQDTLTNIDVNNEKGALIGINQAVQSLGMFVGASFGGILISNYLFAPLLVGVAMFALTFMVNKFLVSKRLEQCVLRK